MSVACWKSIATDLKCVLSSLLSMGSLHVYSIITWPCCSMLIPTYTVHMHCTLLMEWSVYFQLADDNQYIFNNHIHCTLKTSDAALDQYSLSCCWVLLLWDKVESMWCIHPPAWALVPQPMGIILTSKGMLTSGNIRNTGYHLILRFNDYSCIVL